MQPVQIRMNAAVVLIILLLAVPLQLFLSNYIQQVYLESTSSDLTAAGKGASGRKGVESDGQTMVVDRGGKKADNLDAIRADAMNRLSISLKHIAKNIQDTYRYYSTWEHFKELFVIPYKRPELDETPSIQITRNEFGELVITASQEQRKTKPKKKKLKSVKSTSKSTTTGTGSNSATTTSSGTSKATGTSKTDQGKTKSTQTQSKTKVKEVYEPATSRAREVEDYLYNEVYFTHSKTPRNFKPGHIKFSIGQVVTHNTDNFYGVIVGWDEVAKAPEDWLKRHYNKREEAIKTPHYLVLIDSHFDASGVPYHYIPQEDLELVEANIQIRAPELNKYFEGFKNHRHIPRPWLKETYPED